MSPLWGVTHEPSHLNRAPPSSSPAATAMGKANRGRDTRPETLLRSALHRRGLRFRIQRRPARDVRTSADIVFGPARVVVFVDGCFWHRCPEHSTIPKANRDWWVDKLERNVERDELTRSALEERGWTVVRIWEHEPPDEAAERIERLVRSRRPA
jgi:DNA mismatch endonuclease (patch repair protein)